MTTAPDSIQIPEEFVEIASQWHSGQADTLYAVASTGNLTLGNRRPAGCDTDEKWYLQLWRELDSDLSATLRHFRNKPNAFYGDDMELLEDFAEYVETTLANLTAEYGLQDWEPSTW